MAEEISTSAIFLHRTIQDLQPSAFSGPTALEIQLNSYPVPPPKALRVRLRRSRLLLT